MKDQFVTYEIAKALKELGFNEMCLAIYSNRYGDTEIPKATSQHEGSSLAGDRNSDFNSNQFWYVAVPLWQQAIDWFISQKYYIQIQYYANGQYTFSIIHSDNGYACNVAGSYSQAREAAMLKALELIQK